MRLAWVTDPHLNFVGYERMLAFRDELAAAACPVVITGDLSEALYLSTVLPLLDTLEHNVYFVLGNHDYYHSSLARVRAMVARLVRDSARLAWLPQAGVVELAPGVGLVGVDGWADARFGNCQATRVWLSDFDLIEELTGLTRPRLVERLRAWGDREAALLRPLLAQATSRFEHVVIATHVPPFQEAAWHNGSISEDDWLPYFSSKAVGEVIAETFAASTAHGTVLCGHTHGGGHARILPNLEVLTGEARYGFPRILRILEFPPPANPS